MLSASTPNKPTIANPVAVPLLVQILIAGSVQVRVDAITALYNLSSCENISNFVLPSEAVKPLLTFSKDCKRYSKLAEKATGLLEILLKINRRKHITMFSWLFGKRSEQPNTLATLEELNEDELEAELEELEADELEEHLLQPATTAPALSVHAPEEDELSELQAEMAI
ncbi:hypothetical protein BHE74_00048839 [Ensete ventricosum]|nr:hypothetical protein BHE74_00048839 [Ensete ventricosum]